MIGSLRSALALVSPRVRAIAMAVLLLGVAVLALVPTHKLGERAHRPSTTHTTRGPSRLSVSAAQLASARSVARRFLAGYLPFAYGRASASTVPAVEPNVRRQLSRDRVLVTPVERRRRPRVVSLSAQIQAPGVVVATALIDDGGPASYAVRLTLRNRSAVWLVSGVDEG